MSQDNQSSSNGDSYAAAELAYEQLTGTFNPGDRIPLTSVKHAVILAFRMPLHQQ